MEHVDDGGFLEFCGLGQAVENGGVSGALFAPGAHADFAEDDQRAEGAFGVIVGGGAAEADEGEYFGVFARAGDEAFPEGFCLVIGQRVGADNPLFPLSERLFSVFSAQHEKANSLAPAKALRDGDGARKPKPLTERRTYITR